MYIGQVPATGDNSFRILDNITSFTQTFDGSSSSVVSTANSTLTFNNHRFITGQRVIYTGGGGVAIGGLTSSSTYYIIKVDQNTIKLASSLANANNNNAITLTSTGTGTSHTLNVSFDGVNTKFKATYNNGTKAQITRAAQLQISINGVLQQPQDTNAPVNGFGFDTDSVIVFSAAPASTDIFWGNIIANSFSTFDVSDNTVDTFTGNGTNTNFALSKTPANNQNVLVTVNGVVQYPSDATTARSYSVNDNILTFTAAPSNGSSIQVRHIGFAGATSSAVTGFYGRTGNVGLTTADNVVIGTATIGVGAAGTSLLVQGNARITGILTIGTGSITLDGNTNTITGISTISSPSISGVATFSTGPVLIGTGSSTGTASQPLQVTGGGYFSGSVGIGTTNPTFALHVRGTTAARFDKGDTTQIAQVRLRTNQDSYATEWALGQPANSLDFSIAYNNSSSWSEYLRVDTFGNLLVNNTSATGTASQPLQVTGGAYVSGSLGIGLTNPTEKLTVSGNINLNSSGNYIQKTFADNTEEYVLRGSSLAVWNPFVTYTRSTGTSQRGFKFGSFDNSGNRTDWMSIWNGTVGISTSTPAAGVDLQLNGNGNLRCSNPVNSAFDLGLLGGGSDMTAYIYNRANAGLVFGTNNQERVRIDNSGNFGIGVSPSYKLDVNGTLNQRGFIRLTDNTSGGTASDYWIGRGGAGAGGASLALYAPTSKALEFGVANNCYVTVETNALKLNSASTQILNNSGRPILNQSGSILQVVQASTTAVFSTTSTSFVDITGLSASITPSSTSSKILIMCTLYRGTSNAVITNFRFTRAGSALFVGDAAGTKIQSTGANYVGNGDNQAHICVVQMNYLDSPSTTSSTTYAVQMRTQGGETVFVGRTGGDADGGAYPRLPASLILMEVSG